MASQQTYRPPRALSYMGGKAPSMPLSRWIRQIIGYDTLRTYAEPFAGMLGVLRAGPPARAEIVNDRSNHIVTWWQHVRDQPEALARLIRYTPWAQSEYERAVAYLATGGDGSLEHARCVHVAIALNDRHTLQPCYFGTALAYSQNPRRRDQSTHCNSRLHSVDFDALADRLRQVQITCRDACDFLLKFGRYDHRMMIYCDPPYPSVKDYYGEDFDACGFTDALLAAQDGPHIAISGYNDEWDHLGWLRHEYAAHGHKSHTLATAPGATRRTEVLWTNFEPHGQQQLFAD